LCFTRRPFQFGSDTAILCAGSLILALGLCGSAAAQVIPGPLKVTDSGPSVSPSGFAIKGITSYSNDSAVFGYGTSQRAGTGIDGVTGYVESAQSVGVVGWSSPTTGAASFGVYGYSGNGNGVYGQTNSSNVASIYGVSNVAGGTAIYGFSLGQGVLGLSADANGVVGMTQASPAVAANYAGVLGEDTSTGQSSNYGVAGTSLYSILGIGVYGSTTGAFGSGVYGTSNYTGNPDAVPFGDSPGVLGTNSTNSPYVIGVAGVTTNGTGVYGAGDTGVEGSSDDNTGYGVLGQNYYGTAGYGVVGLGTVGLLGSGSTGVLGSTSSGVAAEFTAEVGTGLVATSNDGHYSTATLAMPTGEGGVFIGLGDTGHPALVAMADRAVTDQFETVNVYGLVTSIVQAGTANYSGYADEYGSDVQTSGDLYVQGRVYQLCSQGSRPQFPVTSPSGRCEYDGGLKPAVQTRDAQGDSVTTYTPHQSLPTMEDFGEAQLVGGRADIPLEHTFASTMDPNRSYLVFVTPEGDCNGLYVTGKSAAGFVVRELKGGHSTLAFQYRIVAHPYGDTSARLPFASKLAPAVPVVQARYSAPQVPASLSKLTMPRFLKFRPRNVSRFVTLGRLPNRLPPPIVRTSINR
jgi:hypothetical protein